MKTIGIIAEYNPFHNGHAYQIRKIKEQTGADFVIIAMSGDFVQRGTPAIIDKYARARMALSCGADLVIELPVLWATASAEYFAMAGVSLFDKMGCIDGLCFGAETDQLPLLSSIADILLEEPECYRESLSSYIKQGMNFPLARTQALRDLLTNCPQSASCDSSFKASSKKGSSTDISGEELQAVLSSPNNILAIEYLKALKRRGSKITPLLLKREGAGYHETEIRTDSSANVFHSDAPRASATAIRETLLTPDTVCDNATAADKPGGSALHCNTDLAFPDDLLARSMPDAACSVLKEYARSYPLLQTDDFSSILNYRLLVEEPTGFGAFYDANPDISNRLIKNRSHFLSFTQFCEQNKSRDITYSRMSRILLHTLLNLTNEDASLGKKLDYIPYLRLLGFRRESSALLSDIKKSAQVPMISKLADAQKLLDEPALHMLRQDIFAAELYEQVLTQKMQTHAFTKASSLANNASRSAQTTSMYTKTTPRSEYTRGIVLI